MKKYLSCLILLFSFSVFANDSYRVFASNTSFLKINDVRSNSVFYDISSTGGTSFEIAYSYPNITYLVILIKDKNNLYLKEASETIILLRTYGDEAVNTLNLSVISALLANLNFSNVSVNSLFKNINLNLSEGVEGKAVINIDKAFLYNNPNEKNKIKMYLITGDLVSIIEYRSSWLLIDYKRQNGVNIRKWIKIDSIL
ncbi:hypothetical protein [Pragia fontium]|uniref:hypothetical protein n=1 Tax=Pragia fontium TaxID=82985 RepID=UPI000F6EED6B|nr:hypothetical protein [Pragia fontium]VEJ56214.1 Uncharacterised protein [Pragia fontium]